MNDPDGIYDTDPMGAPPPGEEGTLVDEDAATDPEEPWFEEVPGDPEIEEDWWSWPFTFDSEPPRRDEIVARASSDGAKFAAYACEADDDAVQLQTVVASPDGQRILRTSGEGLEPAELGRRLARQALQRGAAELLRLSCP